MQLFQCFKNRSSAAKTDPLPKPGETKPRGLTPKITEPLLAPKPALCSPPPRVLEIATSTLLLVHGFPEMKSSAGTPGTREGWGRTGGGRGKNSRRIQRTALLASTDDSFQWECMAPSTRWLHRALLAGCPQIPGVPKAGRSSSEGKRGELGKVEQRSLIGSCRGWPDSAPITLESSTVVKTAAEK